MGGKMRIEDTSDYEHAVEQRCQGYVDQNYLVIALNEEAGEVAGWYKKFVLRENPTGKLTKDDLKGELGDVLFYLTRLADINGWSLLDVMEHNIEKLDKRRAEGMKQIALISHRRTAQWTSRGRLHRGS
jgi:NTP pyrophosphatase (non-canonical NTP hydrolase)